MEGNCPVCRKSMAEYKTKRDMDLHVNICLEMGPVTEPATKLVAAANPVCTCPLHLRQYVKGPRIGRGASAEIYLVYDVFREPKVLKQITDVNADNITDVENMAELCREFDHPNIISYLDVFRHVSDSHCVTVCILMPHLGEVQDMARYVEICSIDRFEETFVRNIGAQVASALKYLHEHAPLAFCHGDVKLENLLWDETTNTTTLCDLETVQVLSSPYIKCKVNTYTYKAPEQARDKICARTDVWALSCALFVLAVLPQFPPVLLDDLTTHGVTEFETRVKAKIRARGYSESMADIILSGLKEKPEHRSTSGQCHALLQGGTY